MENLRFLAIKRVHLGYLPAIRKLLLALCFLGMPVWQVTQAQAQLQTIVTRHFRVHFQAGAQGTARRVAETAEEVFAPLAAAFDYYDDFQTIHVLVLDNSDMLGQGMANYYTNTIYLWATNLDHELRGTHNWIRNVLTHELTHIITLNKARQRWPFQFAVLRVGRYDSNPDISFTFPLYHMNTPRGWAEGIAQYGPHRFGYEAWDSHRDMVLRMAALEDDLLSYAEMGTVMDRTGKYYGELLYNQGYAMMLYIEDQYGADKVDALGLHAGSMSFDPAVRRVLGISADRLYADWKAHITSGYQDHAAAIRAEGLFTGEPHEELNQGIIEYHPRYSPDGTRLAFISSEHREFAIPYLRIHDIASGETRTLKGHVDSRVSWSPNGQEILFARNKDGFNDLFIYNLETERERRISARLRAKDPAFSPDGRRIAFVHNADGTNNLALIDPDGTNLAYLTNNDDGTQYWAPHWSPDGQWILFNAFREGSRDIVMIRADSPPRPKDYGIRDRRQASQPDSLAVFPDSLAIPHPDTSGFRLLVSTVFDERDPCWLPDGSGFVFASDRTGVFNLYQYTMETGDIQQLTNVLGGAFTPTVAGDGRVTYSGYQANDYSLYEFQLGEYSQAVPAEPAVDRDYLTLQQLPSLQDEYTVSPYRGRQILSWVPILEVGPTYVGDTFGLNQVKLGIQGSSGEMLGRERLTAWGLLGKNFREDTDLNVDLGMYYQRYLLPLEGHGRVFNPMLYIGAQWRRISNLLTDTQETLVDVVPAGNLFPVPADTANLVIPAAEQHWYQAVERHDLIQSTISHLAVGVELPLTRRQRLNLQYAWRDLNEDWVLRRFHVKDQVYIVQDGMDITAQLPPAVQAQLGRDSVMVHAEDTRAYHSGMNFYSAHDLGVSWHYRSVQPTANRAINPKGRALGLLYRYHHPTVVDFLSDQGIDDQGQRRGEHVDDLGFPTDAYGVRQDRLVPVERDLQVNEYAATYLERVGLPYDNTLSLTIAGSQRDIRLKDPGDDNARILEGRYYWPLRYYLGGLNNLSGYPHFAAWGSSRIYARVGYMFPVWPRMSRRMLNLTFSKLYAEIFAEAGAVGNTGSLSPGDWSTDGLLTSVSAELRLQAFSFYRIPMLAYFQVARPLNRDRVHQRADDTPIDRWRYYFGFGLF